MKIRLRLAPAALAATLLLASTGPLPAQVRLPTLGESSDELDLASERRLGDQIMREIRRDPDYFDDPLLLEYVGTLWADLVDASRRRGNVGPEADQRFAWEPFLIRDRTINAFALPGGYIGVYLGLIALTAAPEELASVMAHELSHVTQHHIARSIGEQGRQGVAALAGLILGLIAASRSNNTDVAQAVIVGSQAAMIQGQLNFSRDMEREADRVGFDVLGRAGFAPSGMARMFEKLENANRLNDAGQFPYLRSHPLTSERISDARLRSALGGPGDAPPNAALATAHALMQARARVLMNRGEPFLRAQQALGDGAAAAPADRDNPRERLAALYGSALASALLRDFAKADERLAQARAVANGPLAGDRTAIRVLDLLQVESLVARGDGERATAAGTAFAGDLSRPAMLARAQAAGLSRNPSPATRDSMQELQGHVATHPRDALAWQSLALVAQAQRLPLRALRAEAESFAALGDVNGAVDRMRAAQRAARNMSSPDFVDVSIIDARLRDLEAQRRELLKQLRDGG